MRHFILSDDVANCVRLHIDRLKQRRAKVTDEETLKSIDDKLKTLTAELNEYESDKGGK